LLGLTIVGPNFFQSLTFSIDLTSPPAS
jgi:hypothetical protein